MIKKLYDALKPTNYKLHLNVDSKNSEFSGVVEITAELAASSTQIELHSKDLIVLSASINGVETAGIYEEASDTLVLKSATSIPAGNVAVVLEFRAKITDAMHGMYPCYFEHEGKKKKLIATQFESHHAREVFPCIDEPAAKATFDLTLVTNEGEAVLANMPVKTQASEHERLVTVFETTPKMSSYLLAFVTGEMNVKEAQTKDGVVVRSWASATQDPSWLDYSVKETIDLIEFYNDYFGIPYPLPKCDQVALPDFESGAMENWGLITYRETVLLSDPKNVSLSTQQLISLVVAHELSHQWFGNLVTMAWWDDLWLNESFANMTEYLAVDKLHPEWNIWEEFVAQDVISASNRDVYQDVQAVRIAVNNPDEIHTLFDPSIVYAKGGKLLKMLRDLLGDDAWRAGLKDYFTANAYGNTTRDDLWEALNSHSKLDIPALMNKWIEQSGQPLVTVAQDDTKLQLSQQRFLLDAKSDGKTWQIPLLSEALPLTFENDHEEVELKDSNWVRLNSSGVGHYVVNYTSSDHKKWLAAQLSDPNVESTWKISRLNELVMLAKHGDTTLAEALETIQASGSEQRAMVWSMISGVLGSSRQTIEGDETSEATLRGLTYDLAKTNYDILGWEYPEKEDSNTTHLRTITLGLVVSSENQDVVAHALSMYRSSDNAELLPAEIRSLIMAVAAKFGTDDEFKDLLAKYSQTTSAEYKTDICSALCATKKPEHIKTLLNLILDTKTIRTQDTIRWFVYLMRNRYAKAATWNWMMENWDWVMKHFGGSKSYDDFARYSASLINTQEMFSSYVEFFKDKREDPALKRAIAIGTEEIKARVAWKKRDLDSVTQWLAEYSTKN